MLPSRNFAGLSLLPSKINPENFRSISERLVILQNFQRPSEEANVLVSVAMCNREQSKT